VGAASTVGRFKEEFGIMDAAFGALKSIVFVLVLTSIASAQDASRDARRGEIAAYLARTETLVPGGSGGKPMLIRPYDWFAVEPPGAIGAEMIPVILQKILPDLAKVLGDADPEDPAKPLFGAPEDAFAKFGFWPDPRPDAKARPLPLGFSSTPGTPGKGLPVSLAVRTCASCHTGRVRLDDGSVRVLVGAPNTELLLHQYDAAVDKFFAKHLADDGSTKELAAAIVKVVDAKHAADPTFFFRGEPGHDAADEARQVATFKALLSEPREKAGILATIAFVMKSRDASRATLKKVAYSKPNSPDLAGGPPGFVDSSGLGLAAFVVPFGLAPAEALFGGATKNDIPSVWGQRNRKGFQWDANIRDELARNLVAALGLVGLPDKMDITRNVVISDFIDGLPPEPYPFAIDAAKAVRGRAIYEANCLACHQPDQHRAERRPPPIFNDLGTDPNRSRVVRPLGYVAIEKALAACYQPTGLAFTYKGKDYRPNDAVDGNALFVPRFAAEDQGYVAGPLDGVWARAPYLHNGSVPTLRQLLAPKTRVGKFVRGAISFDKADVGWDWRPEALTALRTSNPSARLYDTAQDGQSAVGHDRTWWVDGEGIVGPKRTAYRLTWADPADPAVDDLIEYLKTL
jgi:hypothetical protein